MEPTDKHYSTNLSKLESGARQNLIELFESCPIPLSERLSNLALFIKRQDLSRLLFMHEMYQKIINVHGVIMEFGVRWGQNLALLSSLRGTYEPFNHNRKIIGFDTFSGFPSVHEKDGKAPEVSKGEYSVSPGYLEYLDKILTCHEKESPISHMKKFELIKGNAEVELEKYLARNPQTIVAFAYFDFDIYQPTKHCLEALEGHLTKGSVLAFDELNDPNFPGETLALKEVFGLGKYRIRRLPYTPLRSYIVIE